MPENSPNVREIIMVQEGLIYLYQNKLQWNISIEIEKHISEICRIGNLELDTKCISKFRLVRVNFLII